MTPEQYQREAERTIYPDYNEVQRLTVSALGLCGEMGEAIQHYYEEEGSLEDLAQMKSELGDVLWYLAICCNTVGIAMQTLFDFVVEDPLYLWGALVETCAFAEMIKKYGYHRNGKSLDIQKVQNHLGRLALYLKKLCFISDFAIEDVMEANIAKLRERHPEGFVPRYVSDSGDSK